MSRFFRRSAIAVAVTAVLLVFASCKPKAGQKCQTGQAACIDSRNALACGPDGKYQPIPCKGPAGCTIDRATKRVTCDDSAAEEGDGCLLSQTENWACSPDRKKALICEDSKFKLNFQCRGPKACSIETDILKGDIVHCDISLQQKGDPCKKPGQYACSTDQKQMLQCKDGEFNLYRYCRGQNGCQVKANSDVNCDEALAELNDPCGIPGNYACSTDAKSELVCQGGKFVRSRDCKRSGCHITMYNRIDCQ